MLRGDRDGPCAHHRYKVHPIYATFFLSVDVVEFLVEVLAK